MTSVNEQLNDFFKTGNLKNIRLGAVHEMLTALLGRAESMYFSSGRDAFPVIYKYGRLEFYFENKSQTARLSGIMFQPIPAPAANGHLICDYHDWTAETGLPTAKQFLQQHRITFSEEPPDDETLVLLTEGKVRIYFDLHPGRGVFLLQKAGRFAYPVSGFS